MRDKLGIGIVGAGFMARFHLQAFVGVRNADIVGITSRTKERAESAAALARGLGIGDTKAYASVKDLVTAPGVDAVWIVAPNFTRLDTMREIAKYGKGKLIGVACEKPLGRNVREALEMLQLVESMEIPHGYLENQVFMPSVTRGKEIVWARGAGTTGRPYLARCAEEHSGPHEPWFWSGEQQGGGVLNDMMCHSIEAARFLVTEPGKPRDSVRPKTVSGEIATLKFSRKEYIERLKKDFGVDYARAPAEDFARASVTWEAEDGSPIVTECTTSWSFVGPGLRLSLEVMGPEYYMHGASLNNHLEVFFSRRVTGKVGEDLVEKQNAEQGLMPVVPDEANEYGYVAENRHMVEAFRKGERPSETFSDGVEVTCLLMAAYKSAEEGKRLTWPVTDLHEYVPAPARETYTSKDLFLGAK